jgi:hypothetical protein
MLLLRNRLQRLYGRGDFHSVIAKLIEFSAPPARGVERSAKVIPNS